MASPEPAQYYVDPSIAADSGAGTVGDPYGDLEYCLEQITPHATNGDQINIKAGTDEVLEFPLDIAGDYGTPTLTKNLTFRGYTTVANDGGIGGINGNGDAVWSSATIDYVVFADLHLHNCGSANILTGDDGCAAINCELDTTTGKAIVFDDTSKIINCYVHTVTGATGIETGTSGIMYGNFVNAAITTVGILCGNTGVIVNNIVKLAATNAADGIRFADNNLISSNSVFATAGTGAGIVGSGGGRDANVVINNIVEGFSGVGGIGYDASATDHWLMWGHNAAYNNTINNNISTIGGVIIVDIGGDDIPLDASPFTDPASLDFSVGTEVKATAMANFVGGGTTPGTTQFLDMGAAQREEPAGGGGGTTVPQGLHPIEAGVTA